MIADVDAVPVEITPPTTPEGEPLDLSMSGLRSVSPVHIEYLRNMGVAASMSISIVRDGELWGLCACHNMSPKLLSSSMRNAAETFGQMFSLMLEARQRDEALRDEERAQALHVRILSLVANTRSSSTQLQRLSADFQDLINCDGLAICMDGAVMLEGSTPSMDQMTDLIRFLNTGTAGDVLALNSIKATYERGGAFASSAAGLLAIPISRSPRDYLIFFRREIMRAVNWAGDPNKPATLDASGNLRLSPRKSFETYRELVSGHCEPWNESEIRLARALRVTLLEVVLKLADAAEHERQRAHEKQEILISELNHRVRNLLGLVRGLIRQTKNSNYTIEMFTDVLDHRIQALARAHDQITAPNWSPTSLRVLIRKECAAYLADREHRLHVDGTDVLLEPESFATIALVVHELVTNSAKYGALSNDVGSVSMNIQTTHQDHVELTWTEQGGPTVTPPERRGFGSTIIERSIPFQLEGQAVVDFRPEGLHARFTIPLRHVAVAAANEDDPTPEKPASSSDAPDPATVAPGKVLVVEDNVIIAMDAEHLLLSVGATEVVLASHIADARTAIREHSFDFALLDVNLGSETSIPIANELSELGVPFIFVTGYGDQIELPDEHRHTVRMGKPFHSKMIVDAITKAKEQEKR